MRKLLNLKENKNVKYLLTSGLVVAILLIKGKRLTKLKRRELTMEDKNNKSKEWQEGADAFDAGLYDQDNPYQAGSKENKDWAEGFLAYWNYER